MIGRGERAAIGAGIGGAWLGGVRAAPAPPSASGVMVRTNNFDALRLLAAATVVYGHGYPLSHVADVSVLGNSVEALAVKVFFVISGYLVSESWSRDPRLPAYLLRRSLRIFPGLIAVVLLAALVLGPVVSSLPLGSYLTDRQTASYLWNTVLYPIYVLPGAFGDNPYPLAVNGSLWSLPVEFAMYLLTPVLLSLPLRGGARLRVILATVAICGMSLYWTRLAPPGSPPVIYGTNLISALDAAPYFLLGACYRIARWDRWAEPQAAILLVFALAWVPPKGVFCETALFIGLPYIVLAFANAERARFADAGRFGDFSYGIYLYGFPVQQAVAMLAGTGGHPLRNFAISFPLVLMLAVLSWHLIERRALAFKPQILRPATPTARPVRTIEPAGVDTLAPETR
jgi:peptidoglycan/LPS O-acetylase OafA/YrhL